MRTTAAQHEPRPGGPPAARGAYGFRIAGFDDETDLLSPVDPTCPELTVHAEVGVSTVERDHLDDDEGAFCLRGGGTLHVSRVQALARFVMPSTAALPTVDAMIHPYLAAPAAAFSSWNRRNAFHGGAFVAHGVAWVIVGSPQSGKSTTLAVVANRGLPVLADDLAVIEQGDVHAGPNSIDLRRDAANRLRLGSNLGTVGHRERWRVPIDHSPPRVPLGGWIVPAWGPSFTLTNLSVAHRVRVLHEHLALRIPPTDARAVLDLATRPCLRWTRPRAWSAVDDSVDRLVSGLGTWR